METLKGRTALVTGASRGLGAAIALELAARGANVAVNYFARRERAEQLCARIRNEGGEATPYYADVRLEADITGMIQAINDTYRHIDIAVINATGPQPFLTIEEQTWERYLDQLDFFVKSPLLVLKHVVAGMKSRGFGRIIQIGSEVFELGNPMFAHYVAAKGAQLGQTRSWARELATTGITVNLVAPGWIPTERHLHSTQAEMDAYTERVPMRHMGTPQDVADTVAFLASDEGRFITGQRISVNGGNTLA
ncbi:MAG TPA: SDR family oxidoreductase [Acidobacteriaceae bacterium]|nr:SDR family oxidoreductase [Acidobacteriaceae bacterium]